MQNRIEELAITPGRIKNETLFQRDGMRVAVIAMAAGNELKAHSAPVDVLVIGLEGEAEIRLEEETFLMKPKQNIEFPAKAIHSVKAVSDFKMLLIK